MNNYLKFTTKIAEKAGKKLLHGFERVSVKTRDASISTKYDKLSDKIIRQAIAKNFPDHSILSEEMGKNDRQSDYLWIVDPIDGTGNFANGNPLFSVSIALWYRGEPILGVIEVPFLRRRYIAEKGKGAVEVNTKTGRKKRVKVSSISKMGESYMLFCGGHASDKSRVGEFVANYYSRVRSIRKIGSAAIELAWVGSGRAESFITPKAKIWDIAAGVLFVKEAGGRVMGFDLNEYDFSDMLEDNLIDLAVANAKLNLGEQIDY